VSETKEIEEALYFLSVEGLEVIEADEVLICPRCGESEDIESDDNEPFKHDSTCPVTKRISILRAALAAALPASDCPACGWQEDQEALDCEAAYERATGRKLEPGDREFLTFRAGWIAGHTRAAQPKAPSPTPGEVERALLKIEWELNGTPGGKSSRAPWRVHLATLRAALSTCRSACIAR
jgi:hypothetical protein